MVRTLVSLIYCLIISNELSYGQTPISPFTWTGSPASATGPSAFTTLPATISPGATTVSISQWDRGSVVFNAGATCYNSNNWQVGGSFASAQANNRCIYFTVVNSGTTELQVTRILIRSQVSATGPQNVQLTSTIGASTLSFGAPIATAHNASPETWDFSENLCIGAGQTATFRLYGWGATSSAGTLRINDGTSIVAGYAPALIVSAGSTSPVCIGGSLSLTSTVSGGIPGYTYSWSGPGGFSSTAASPFISSVTAGAAGIYTLTVSDVLSCSTLSSPATTAVTVNPLPAAISGSPTVCPLLTAAYSSASTGGTWTVSDATIATINATSGVLTAVSPGTVTISYTLPTGCSATTVVTVSTPPTSISGTSTYCIGDTATLTSAPAGGIWTSSAPTIATVASGSGHVTGVASGTAIITYTEPLGCISNTTINVLTTPGPISAPGEVCEGQSIVATIALPGGLWSSADELIATIGSLSGLATGVSSGVTSISYILPTGCFSVKSLTINPLPATPIGILASCVGSNVSLTSATPGGTWSSSMPTVASVGSLTGIVSPVSAGTTIISYVLTSTGCRSEVIFTTNPLPAGISGAAAVCAGDSVLLTNIATGGTWISGNTSIATIHNISGWLTGVAAGTVSITYQLTTTGCVTVRTQTVNGLPTAITGPLSVCTGQTISLSSSPTGGTWSVNNPAIATIGLSTGVVSGLVSGTVVTTYTTSAGCKTARQITVNPSPTASVMVIGDTIMCPGDFVILTAGTSSGVSYQWFNGASPLSGAILPTNTATTSGNYRVRVTNTFSCPGFSAPVTVSVNPVTASITVPSGATSGCSGTPITLNANTGTGYTYQWLMAGTAIAGATNATYGATMSSDYSVRITNATGCTDVSAPVMLSFIPSPDASITVSGPLTFCSGGNVNLMVPGATTLSYQWYNGAIVLPGATNSTYTASASGSFSCVVSNASGCTSVSTVANVVVNSLPSPVISTSGPTTLCPGVGVTLSASAGAAYQYQWYRTGMAIPGATSSSYYASVSGGYRIRVTNTATGCSAITAADTTVTVLSSLIVIPLTPSFFCWGGSSLLSTNILSGGVTFQWLRSGGAIAGATSNTYSASETGSYNCSVSVSGSCTFTGTPIEVKEHPLPDPIITRSGSLLTAQENYISYQWYKDLGPIYGATSSTLTASSAGLYKVRVTDTNGCQAVSATYVLAGGAATGVEDIADQESFRIYPNPAKGWFKVEGMLVKEMQLYNPLGILIARSRAQSAYDISSIPAGAYWVVLIGEDKMIGKAPLIITE